MSPISVIRLKFSRSVLPRNAENELLRFIPLKWDLPFRYAFKYLYFSCLYVLFSEISKRICAIVGGSSTFLVSILYLLIIRLEIVPYGTKDDSRCAASSRYSCNVLGDVSRGTFTS